MFITFEGIDGCGKSTQVRMLEEHLRFAVGKEVVFVRDPGHTAVSEAVRSILLGRGEHSISARTELLLYSSARAELVETVIRPALERGAVVVSDRFTDSTIAYQGFGRELPMDDIHRANAVATGGLSPLLTFYLDIPLHLAKERCLDKDADRMELAGDAFFGRVIAGYSHLADAEPHRVRRMDATLDRELLHEQIWHTILSLSPRAIAPRESD
jgi:dTMP kinase